MAKTDGSRSVFSRASLKLTRLVNTSLFARAVFCYPKENAAVENGLFGTIRKKLGLKDASRLRFKMRINTLLHSSASQGLYARLIRFLLTARLRSLGTFCFLFGFLNCVTFFIRRLLFGYGAQSAPSVIFGVCLILAALPLFSARSTIASALWNSRTVGWFLRSVVGLREDELPSGGMHSGEVFASLAALVSGLVCFWIGPFLYTFLLFCLISAGLCLYKPEYGLGLILFVFPFLEAPALAALMCFDFFCFLIKALCGKRAVRFELTDALFGLLLIFLIFSGAFAVIPSSVSFLPFCALGLIYYLVSFLGKSRTLIRRFMLAFSIGVALSSALHLIFTLVPIPAFLELSAGVRALSQHASPMLICAGAPLCIYELLCAKTARMRGAAFLLFAVMAADLWLFSSLSADLALGAAIVLLLALDKRAYFFLFLFLVAAAAVALPLIPGEQTAFLRMAFVNRHPSVLALDVLPLSAYFSGFGVFDTETLLSFSPLSAAGESLTLTTQILLSAGLVGLILSALFLIGCVQKAFWIYLSHPRDKARLSVIAPLCSVAALLLLGAAQNIGADPRSFALICLLGALSSASGNAFFERTTLYR